MSIASPLATGGAGPQLEDRVAGYYLAALLTGGAVLGLGEVTARRVELQRAFAGRPLDDVIVDAVGPGGPCRLDLQVKRTVPFGEKSSLLHEVVGQCWRTFKAPDFRRGSDRFGVAVGQRIPLVETAGRTALAWARRSADAAEYFRRIGTRGLAGDGMREFVRVMRTAVDVANGELVADGETLAFLQHVRFLQFDFELDDASGGRVEVVDRLRTALAPEQADRPGDLWRALVDAAGPIASAAGSVDRPALLELLPRDLLLAPQRHLQPVLDRVAGFSSRVLSDVEDTVGGVQIGRDALVAELEQRAADSGYVEIVGEPGAGKSALLKALAERRLAEGPVLVLSAGRMPRDPGWEGLARHLQIAVDLRDVLAELGSGGAPCLFIDGLDRFEDVGAWAAINDIVRAVRAGPSASRWTIVVTARANNLDYCRTRLAPEARSGAEGRIQVTGLSDSELDAIAAAHPGIAPVIRHEGRARELARRPYMLRRLLRSRSAIAEGTGRVLTESDLIAELWSGPPEELELAVDCQDTLLEVGRRILSGAGRSPSSHGLPARALVRLAQDDVLLHDTRTRKVRFVHDILEDWVLAQALQHGGKPVSAALADANQPTWLTDAVQLHAQRLLELDEDMDAWRDLCGDVSTPGLDPRWRRAVLTAPVQSTRAIELLQLLDGDLQADGGRLASELLVAMRTVEIDPNPWWLVPENTPDTPEPKRIEASHRFGTPRWKSWLPFLAWLLPRLPGLAANLVDQASRTLAVISTSYNAMPWWAARHVAPWAAGWLHRLDRHSTDGRADRGSFDDFWDRRVALKRELALGHDDLDKLEHRIRLLLLACAGGAPEPVAAHLQDLAARRPRRAVEMVLRNSDRLAKDMPERLVDLMLAVMAAPRPTRREYCGGLDPVELGIEHDRAFSPASHVRPPFLALLRHAPAQGLRLVNGLCNHAVGVWRDRREQKRSGTPLPIRLRFPWGEREFWGHAREYTWARGSGPGPDAVMSALMALEVWMEEQAASGRPMEEVFEKALRGNDCVGALGACVAVAMADPARGLRAALPFITCAAVWRWDLQRVVQEIGFAQNLAGHPQDWPYLRPVEERNKLPHRKKWFRDLVPRFILHPDAETRADFHARIGASVAGDPPFEFAEERDDPQVVATRRDELRRMEAFADPGNWRVRQVEDGSGSLVEYQHPADLAPEAERVVAEHTEIGRATGPLLWAERRLRGEGRGPDMALADAIAQARALDGPNLFETVPPTGALAERDRQSAVAGVAAVTARSEEASTSDLEWCRSILPRAAATPLDGEWMGGRRSILRSHPLAHAAAGLAALVERGVATSEEEELLLRLACHPMQRVAEAAFAGIARCWEAAPLLSWQALVLGMTLALAPKGEESEWHGGYTGAELRRVAAAYASVVADLRNGCRSSMPQVPPAWIEDENAAPHPRTGRFRPPETLFQWDIASLVLFWQPMDVVLARQERRRDVCALLRGLVGWTLADVAPPWSGERERGVHGAGSQWTTPFLRWAGSVTAHLTNEEARRLLVRPLQEAERKRPDAGLLSEVLRGFVEARFPQSGVPTADTLALWDELFRIVSGHPHADRADTAGGLDGRSGPAVTRMLFSEFGACRFDHPWPGLDAVRPAVDRWVERFGATLDGYPTLIGFLERAGWPLVPDPALAWIGGVVDKRDHDPRFWARASNGERTAALLNRWLDEGGSERKPGAAAHRRRVASIADALVSHGVRLAAHVQQRLGKLERET